MRGLICCMTLPNFARSSSQGPEDEQLDTAEFEESMRLVCCITLPHFCKKQQLRLRKV